MISTLLKGLAIHAPQHVARHLLPVLENKNNNNKNDKDKDKRMRNDNVKQKSKIPSDSVSMSMSMSMSSSGIQAIKEIQDDQSISRMQHLSNAQYVTNLRDKAIQAQIGL